MDCFNNVFTKFLDLEHFSWVAVYGGSDSSPIIKNILIIVPKMNAGLMDLERHEGE